MASQVTHHRFTVTDYEQMMAAGILTEDDRVELVGGEIIVMTPLDGPHVQCVNLLTRMLSRSVDSDMLVSVQNPLVLSDDTEPQPDLVVLRDRRHWDALPTASDAILLIEVADASREYDRGVKFLLYAAAGIAEAWFVDLAGATVERHTEPRDGLYRVVTIARPGESLASTMIPSLAIPVDLILS